MGPTEILILVLVVVLLFGASRLPQVARGLGQSVKEFKKATRDEPGLPEKPSPEKPRPETSGEAPEDRG